MKPQFEFCLLAADQYTSALISTHDLFPMIGFQAKGTVVRGTAFAGT
jgi:hypothetical protein